MKKTVSFMLAAVMTATILTGCGGSGSGNSQTAQGSQASQGGQEDSKETQASGGGSTEGGDITFTMGIANDGTLNGISILDISETAGLGMKAEEVLKPQFAEKNVPVFTYTKTGAVSEDQIDAISGATITTSAVTTAVNGGLYYFQTWLGGGGNEAE